MPRFIVPKNAVPFEVITSRAGTPLVTNCTGVRKVRIPCRSREHAVEVCKQLNERRHNGEVFV
jgi:hypothetical protein